MSVSVISSPLACKENKRLRPILGVRVIIRRCVSGYEIGL
jgi:hypothetical protein